MNRLTNMRKTIPVLLAIFAALLCVLPTSAQKKDVPKGISTEKSSAGHITHMKPFSLTEVFQDPQAKESIPLHQMALEVLYPFSGESPAPPAGEVRLRFQATSNKYIFLKGQEVLLALDNEKGNGRAIDLGHTNYNSKSPEFNTVFVEVLELQVPAEALSRMGKANTVDVFVGPISYRLTKDQQQKLSTFFDYISQ